MSEKLQQPSNEAADRLAAFEANQEAHDHASYWDAQLGEAGKTDFSDDAKKRLEEVNEYHKHLESLLNREAESDEDYYNRLAEEGSEDTFDRALRSDARLRRAEMMAKDIADRRANGGDAEYISDKEAELERLLNEYADSEGADEDIALRIMDLTVGDKKPAIGKESDSDVRELVFGALAEAEDRIAQRESQQLSPEEIAAAAQEASARVEAKDTQEATEQTQRRSTAGEVRDAAASAGKDVEIVAEDDPSEEKRLPLRKRMTAKIGSVVRRVSGTMQRKRKAKKEQIAQRRDEIIAEKEAQGIVPDAWLSAHEAKSEYKKNKRAERLGKLANYGLTDEEKTQKRAQIERNKAADQARKEARKSQKSASLKETIVAGAKWFDRAARARFDTAQAADTTPGDTATEKIPAPARTEPTTQPIYDSTKGSVKSPYDRVTEVVAKDDSSNERAA